MSAADSAAVAALVHAGDRVSVVRVAMGGSCAIPLTVIEPPDVELLTWCFTGFAGQSPADPICLVVLSSPPGDTLHPGAAMTIRTHVRDLQLAAVRELVPLSRAETLVLARAVASAYTSMNARHLNRLLPLLAPGLDAIPAESDGPDFVGTDGSGTVVATGLKFMPTHLLARTPSGYVCADVNAARVRAGPRACFLLTLAPSGLNLGALDRAIFSGGGNYAAARTVGTA